MIIKGHTVIHRKYPSSDWEFKAVSIRVVDDNGKAKDVIYGISKSKGKKRTGVEVYAGTNYVVGSNERSYSRRYNMKDVPTKYDGVVQKAIAIHRKTKWSKAKYIDKN